MRVQSAGAKRGLLNVRDEEVGLVGLHWEDRFFEFVPQNGEVKWEVQLWGSWQVFPSAEDSPCILTGFVLKGSKSGILP